MKKVVCIDNLFGCYKITIGKTYEVTRQDNISYYIKNDRGELDEILRNKFEDPGKLRAKKLKLLGI
jgi:hypothetical protein